MAKQHKDDGGGVQPWSKGEIFPWHVVLRANLKTGVAYCQHPDGRLGLEHPYTCGDTESFYAAHRAATADAIKLDELGPVAPDVAIAVLSAARIDAHELAS